MHRRSVSLTCFALATGLAAVLCAGPAFAAADPSVSPSATGTATGTASATTGVRLNVTFDDLCENYGLDVTNSDDVAHTVTFNLNGAVSTVIVPAGATVSRLRSASSLSSLRSALR